MITATDFVFGQNWVEQARRNLRITYPTLAATVGRHDWAAVGYLYAWTGSRQGERVWESRYEQMRLMTLNRIAKNTLLR